MIWYRHWVEMRLGVLVFAGLCVWLGVSVVGPWRSLEFGQALPLTPLGQAIGAEEVLVWAEFTGRIFPFSLAASLLLRMGFKDVRNVPGSWKAWKALKYQVQVPKERKKGTDTDLS